MYISVEDADKLEVQQDERHMFIEALKKWYFYSNNPLDIMGAHIKFPELESFKYGCSFCEVYLRHYCEGCPLYIHDNVECANSKSTYQSYVHARKEQNIEAAKMFAEEIYNIILESAEERGFIIGEQEYV
jgi:hypothetical protein